MWRETEKSMPYEPTIEYFNEVSQVMPYIHVNQAVITMNELAQLPYCNKGRQSPKHVSLESTAIKHIGVLSSLLNRSGPSKYPPPATLLNPRSYTKSPSVSTTYVPRTERCNETVSTDYSGPCGNIHPHGTGARYSIAMRLQLCRLLEKLRKFWHRYEIHLQQWLVW